MFRPVKAVFAPLTIARAIRGATLLEVMVALVVMSIGLLGLASLQLIGIRANSDSENRTQAAIIANDLAERMRANPGAVAAGSYAGVDLSSIDCTTLPATVCEDRSAAADNCNPSQMASFDTYTSWCNAHNLLRSGKLTISCTDNKGGALACTTTPYRTLKVDWINQVEGGNQHKSLSITFRP